MSGDTEEEVKQRYRPPSCPQYCKQFNCVLIGDCNDECKKLDQAKAMICELCNDQCNTEKKKIILLNTVYYQEKKKLFSSNILDGVHGVKERHYYLETRWKEERKKQLETDWYKFSKKTEHKNDAKKIKFELELLRKFMDMLNIPFEKNLDFDEKP